MKQISNRGMLLRKGFTMRRVGTEQLLPGLVLIACYRLRALASFPEE